MQNISVPLHLTFVNVCNLCVKQIGQGSKFGIITACRFLGAKTYTDGAINNYNNIITDCYIYVNWAQFSKWKCPDPIYQWGHRVKIWSGDETSLLQAL